MNSTLNLPRNLIIFGIPVGLLGLLIFLTKFSFQAGNDIINLAISADLLLTVPLIYFLLIRKTTIPNITVVPVIVLGLLIGTYFLPKEDQNYLELFKIWIMPIIEISVLTLIVIKVRSARKRYNILKENSPDFFSTLKDVCYEILPAKMVLPFATEIAVIYYGFINWKVRTLTENEFSYHKKSGTPTLFGVFIFIISIETFIMHIFLVNWSETAAWILSGLSIYTAIQVLGFTRSLSKRPISLNQDQLILCYGILSEVKIQHEDIEQIEFSRKLMEKDSETITLSPFRELESHNVIIHLNKTYTLIGFYGFKKNFKTLLFHIDDETAFKKKIETLYNKR